MQGPPFYFGQTPANAQIPQIRRQTMNVTVIGAGLAGCEAAYQLLRRGIAVTMYEMRPEKSTGAHKTGGFAAASGFMVFVYFCMM